MIRRLNESSENELMNWAESIPMDELWDEIGEVTGINDWILIMTSTKVVVMFELSSNLKI